MHNSAQPPGDEHHEKTWRVTLAVMFIAQFLSGVGFSFVLPFFPFYFRELGVTSQEQNLMWNGWASLVFGITMTVSAPLWGLLADKYGRKLMVMRSMFAGSVILGLMGQATNPWHLVALRMFQGATTGTVTASITLVSSITPSVNLGFSLGLLQTAMLLGAAAGPILGGFLAELYGIRLTCTIASGLLLTGAILVIFGAVEKFAPPEKKTGGGVTIIKGIIGTSGFKMIMAIYFLVYVMNQMLTPILPLYIESFMSETESAESMTGLTVGITYLIAGLSAMMYGKLGDRYGYTKILVISLVATGIISIPQAFATGIWVLFIERCLTGLAIGGLIPSVSAIVSRIISREKIGSAYGLTSSVTCLGIGMGPFIGGVMASLVGLRFPFAFMGIVAFVIAVTVQTTINRSASGFSGIHKLSR